MQFTKFPHIDFTALRQELKAVTPATFGSMNAQQMIEHLSLIYDYILSDRTITILTPEEKIEKMKKLFLWSPGGFKQGVVNDFTRSLSFETKHPDIVTAINEFEKRHQQVANVLAHQVVKGKTHPVFGLLNNEEWLQFFTKHTWHHFNQFSLVSL